MNTFDILCSRVQAVTGLSELSALAVAEELDDRGHSVERATVSVIMAVVTQLGFNSAEDE